MTRRRGHFHQTPCGTNHALATESRPVGQRLSWREDRREAKNYPRRSLPSHHKRTQTEPATGHYPLARWKLLREKLGHFIDEEISPRSSRRHGEEEYGETARRKKERLRRPAESPVTIYAQAVGSPGTWRRLFHFAPCLWASWDAALAAFNRATPDVWRWSRRGCRS